MRELATIRQIGAVITIEGADSICSYVVDGWNLVDRKGKYQLEDLVIYCEIDSWIPESIAPFLTKSSKGAKTYKGVVGNLLKTAKLRGTLSQGLLLDPAEHGISDLFIDMDVTDDLGIILYDRDEEIRVKYAGNAFGAFPTDIPKTGLERVQNIYNKLDWFKDAEEYDVTVKLDGTSCTMYHDGTELRVCSKNINLKRDDTNLYWQAASWGCGELIERLFNTGAGRYAIQGEIVGPGIQGNRHHLKAQEFRVYNFRNLETGGNLSFPYILEIASTYGFSTVPYYGPMSLSRFSSLTELLQFVDDADVGEGLVFKNSKFQFKALSNNYLLKYGG